MQIQATITTSMFNHSSQHWVGGGWGWLGGPVPAAGVISWICILSLSVYLSASLTRLWFLWKQRLCLSHHCISIYIVRHSIAVYGMLNKFWIFTAIQTPGCPWIMCRNTTWSNVRNDTANAHAPRNGLPKMTTTLLPGHWLLLIKSLNSQN